MARKTPLSAKKTDDLLKALLVLARTVQHVLETRPVEVAGDPLSRSKVQILRLLAREGAQTPTQVAHYLGVSKPAVTQIIAAMVRSRLVKRRATRHDRRGFELSLTPAGTQKFREILLEQRHVIRSSLRDADEGTGEGWRDSLREITGALARADRTFKQYCLQCRAHSDGTCILVGGSASCPFLSHSSPAAAGPEGAERTDDPR